MKELTVFEHDHVDVVDSRQVAEMIGKPHNDLMKSIRTYCEYLGQGDFSQSDFFIPSVYTNSQNKEQPCYLLTKKGCDMVANKMTGEKGVLFTAAYVTAFEAMRKHIEGESKTGKLPKPMTDYQQMMAETRRRNAQIQEARIYTELARRYKGTTYEQVLNAHATKSLSGEYLLPLPEAGERLMSAGEVGAKLGISSNLVGKLANKHGLKIDRYGKWMHDKSPYSPKEVPSFRYKECVVDKLREILAEI